MTTKKGQARSPAKEDKGMPSIVERTIKSKERSGAITSIQDIIAMIEPNVETFRLATKGLIYPIETVEIRSMTTKEEKKMASISARTFNRQINSILQAIVKSPPDFDPAILTIGDRMSLITWLRITTYGPNYVADVECPRCEVVNKVSYDLNQLDVIELPDDFIEPQYISLNSIPGGINLRLMKVGDELANEQWIAQQRKLSKGITDEDDWTLRYARTIEDIVVQDTSVDNLNFRDKIVFFENLPGNDTLKIRQWHEKYQHGVDLRVPFQCTACNHEEASMILSMNASFFLPIRAEE